MRHSLSLSRNFHRVGVGDGDCKAKKGLQWEVLPEKREAVNREIALYYENNSRLRKQIQKPLEHGR